MGELALIEGRDYQLVDETPVIDTVGRLVITRGSQVKLEPVKWVMPDWIPERSLVLLAGREGLGKSTIACNIAAQVTNGSLEGAYEDPRSIVYLHSEDSRSLTVAPRLRAAGADMDKVLFIDVRANEHDILQLPRDIHELEKLVEANDVGLIVLDAARSMMSTSGTTDRQVREFLEPLVRMCDRQNCVVLALVHFSKARGADTGRLILGSIAWSQVPRSVISVAATAKKNILVVANTKGNLAPRMRSEKCQINTVELECDDEVAEVGVVEWLGETDENPLDLLAGNTADKDIDQWLREFLSDGMKQANEVFVAADASGFSKDQAKRAKKRIGVLARHPGGVGPWYWELGQ